MTCWQKCNKIAAYAPAQINEVNKLTSYTIMLQTNVTLEGKTVLVTGAAGFIGSNLVKRLFHDVKEIRVVGIDSMTDYYDVNIKRERLTEIEALAASPEFRLS